MYDLSAQAAEDVALRTLLGRLQECGYAFITPTPATVRLVRDRHDAGEDALRDIFGWTRRFWPEQLEPALLEPLRAAGLIEQEGDRLRSRVRVSTVDGAPYVHSAPSDAGDAVFLGPDSYRYARLLRDVLEGARFERALDIGAGAGVGALTLASIEPEATVFASDINPAALRYARFNAEAAGRTLGVSQCDGLPSEPATFDVIAANPPYIAGNEGRIYRDGGDRLGAAVTLDWLRAGLPRLRPGGRFVLYTGSAIVRGRDAIREESGKLAEAHGCDLRYEEIDPDVFSATLRQPAYAQVERIAVVGAVFTAPG